MQVDLFAQRDMQALKAMLNTPLTRWFLMRLLDRTGVYSKSFTGNSETFFKEGKREIGRLVLADIQNLGLEGLDLKHTAEKEYAAKKIEFTTIMRRKEE